MAEVPNLVRSKGLETAVSEAFSLLPELLVGAIFLLDYCLVEGTYH
jgi:hypothetical protein